MRRSLGLSIVSIIAITSFVSEAGNDKKFAPADKNKDNLLQAQEFYDYRAELDRSKKRPVNLEQAKRFFKSKDKDKSGDITLAEFVGK